MTTCHPIFEVANTAITHITTMFNGNFLGHQSDGVHELFEESGGVGNDIGNTYLSSPTNTFTLLCKVMLIMISSLLGLQNL